MFSVVLQRVIANSRSKAYKPPRIVSTITRHITAKDSTEAVQFAEQEAGRLWKAVSVYKCRAAS